MKTLLLVLIGLPILVFALGRLGVLRGHPPTPLGLHDGKLASPVLGKTNSVSSQYAAKPGSYHAIAPISFAGQPNTEFAKLRTIVGNLPGCTIVNSQPDYLYAQCETRWLRFIDDLEFSLDAANSQIHLRSASRLGRKDFGVNRARIEAIRQQFSSPTQPEKLS